MPVSKVVSLSKQKEPGFDEKQLELEVLSAIESEAHRPGAIVNILGGRYDRNAVVKSLIALEKNGKAEREGSRAWIAKGKLERKSKESKSEKAKPKKD